MRVVALGSRGAGDDAAGLLVGDRLRRFGYDVVEPADVAQLVEALREVKAATVVDAALGPGGPGTVHRMASAAPVLRGPAHSSHGLGLAEAVALARALGAEPALTIYAIVGRDFGLGAAVSAEVELAVRLVAEEIRGCA